MSSNQTSEDDALESPFFPKYYPRDLSIEHLIECNINDSIDCFIEIAFSDFQISLASVMEVGVIGCGREWNILAEKFTSNV